MSLFYIKQGDRRPTYEQTLAVGGVTVDLTGLTITLKVTDSAGVQRDFTGVADPDQVTNKGKMSYEWAEGDMDVAGRFKAVVHVVFADTTDQTFPTRGYDRIIVLGNMT